MERAYVVTGSVVDGQTIRLDEALPIAAGKVRVVVEPLPVAGESTLQEVLDKIHRGQRERGFVPPTRDVVDAYLRAERESWDDE